MKTIFTIIIYPFLLIDVLVTKITLLGCSKWYKCHEPVYYNYHDVYRCKKCNKII